MLAFLTILFISALMQDFLLGIIGVRVLGRNLGNKILFNRVWIGLAFLVCSYFWFSNSSTSRPVCYTIIPMTSRHLVELTIIDIDNWLLIENLRFDYLPFWVFFVFYIMPIKGCKFVKIFFASITSVNFSCYFLIM